MIADDGTRLAFREEGDGAPLLCLPGGPMQDARYLGDLGGLASHRRLILVDPRGTGRSGEPLDRTSYRCDRQVPDIEALLRHLRLDRVDVLAHSAGANLAVLHAMQVINRVEKLALITPSLAAVGIDVTAEQRLEVARRRSGETWFAAAFAALTAVVDGHGGIDSADLIAPFRYGRWDDVARDQRAAELTQRNDEAAAVFGEHGAFDPELTRAALAQSGIPVLVLAGELDVNSPPAALREYAALLRSGEFVLQPGGGHFPWLDDRERFVAIVSDFLR